MADRMYLHPAAGRSVRIPHTDLHLPETGSYVEDCPYWRRRVQTGDALQATPPTIALAYGAIDRAAELLEQAVAQAKASGSTAEAATAALEEFQTKATPHLEAGRELANRMDDAEVALVESYAGVKFGQLRAELDAMITPPPPPAPKAKAKKAAEPEA